MQIVEWLRRITEIGGVSGYEQQILDALTEDLAPLSDELSSDALGNLIALKRGRGSAPRRSIMLAAHTDEIGLMVSGFEGAFIRFARVGGIDARNILGQEVIVHGQRDLPGIIASHPPHLSTPAERKKTVALKDLYVDIGYGQESVASLVQIGDLITLKGDTVELANGYVAGKAFDDRAGVGCLIVCLEQLQRLAHDWDVYAVATSQEELGLRGATVAAFGIDPDVAIAIDVGFGAQRGVDEEETLTMDGGPAIAVGPNIHPVLRRRIEKVAKANEITHQFEYAAGATGTDAWAIQVSREGIPTALLSLPLRYMHSTVETLCTRDMDRTGRLLAHVISSLDDPFAQEVGL